MQKEIQPSMGERDSSGRAPAHCQYLPLPPITYNIIYNLLLAAAAPWIGHVPLWAFSMVELSILAYPPSQISKPALPYIRTVNSCIKLYHGHSTETAAAHHYNPLTVLVHLSLA